MRQPQKPKGWQFLESQEEETKDAETTDNTTNINVQKSEETSQKDEVEHNSALFPISSKQQQQIEIITSEKEASGTK